MRPALGNLLDGFGFGLKVVILNILEAVFIGLWSMLLLFPGVIAYYSYSQAIYILVDDPTKSPMQCIRESKAMMAGHKGELFALDLSFLGWYLLSLIPMFGYAVRVWTVPYIGRRYRSALPAVRTHSLFHGGIWRKSSIPMKRAASAAERIFFHMIADIRVSTHSQVHGPHEDCAILLLKTLIETEILPHTAAKPHQAIFLIRNSSLTFIDQLFDLFIELIDKGEAAVPNEKYAHDVAGPHGMWQDFGFYQRFEAEVWRSLHVVHVPRGDGC